MARPGGALSWSSCRVSRFAPRRPPTARNSLRSASPVRGLAERRSPRRPGRISACVCLFLGGGSSPQFVSDARRTACPERGSPSATEPNGSLSEFWLVRALPTPANPLRRGPRSLPAHSIRRRTGRPRIASCPRAPQRDTRRQSSPRSRLPRSCSLSVSASGMKHELSPALRIHRLSESAVLRASG